MKTYRVIGLMSGSSLDGLDVALCRFDLDNEQVKSWQLEQEWTFPLTEQQQNKLRTALELDIISLEELETHFTIFMINSLTSIDIDWKKVDLIASHGHTILHLPDKKITRQLGRNDLIMSMLQKPVVGDFRKLDISFGGVGTPMAPLADRDLFPGYGLYVNLGGICNISYKEEKVWKAYDLCPCNQIQNHFAQQLGQTFDRDGQMASLGALDSDLLEFLLNHEYNFKEAPKSLDNHQVFEEWIDPIHIKNLEPKDVLCTHAFFMGQIINILLSEKQPNEKTIFFSGGGTHNSFLMERIRQSNPDYELVIPDTSIIDNKEAILIAYAGLLRYLGKPNFISSVTGARKDVSGGELYLI